MKRALSTKNLAAMPNPEALWKRCVSIALAEATMGTEHPHYRLDPSWEKGSLFTRDNGAGDNFSIAFVRAGIFIRGFDHTSPMSPYASEDGKTLWPGIYDAVPRTMQDLIADPKVTSDPLGVTFCITYGHGLARWMMGVKKFPADYNETPGDGSRWLLAALTENARAFVDWMTDYYGRSVAFEPVATLFDHGLLQEAVLKRLNPKVDFAGVQALATAARYGKGGLPGR